MPFNILIIESFSGKKIDYNAIFEELPGVDHKIINSDQALDNELNSNEFTHVIRYNTELDYSSNKDTPTLIVSSNSIENSEFSYCEAPLNGVKIFNFLAQTSTFSLVTLNSYALNSPDMLAELKGLLLEEFQNFNDELPNVIAHKKVDGIKSMAHQMSSKFTILEMHEAAELSQQIDQNIVSNPEEHLVNIERLSIDIAIVLELLKK